MRAASWLNFVQKIKKERIKDVSKELHSMREAFGNSLVEMGEKNENLVVLDADVSKSTMTDIFKNVFRKRFFNMGIAEQDMTATAAGMATAGLAIGFGVSSYFR